MVTTGVLIFCALVNIDALAALLRQLEPWAASTAVPRLLVDAFSFALSTRVHPESTFVQILAPALFIDEPFLAVAVVGAGDVKAGAPGPTRVDSFTFVHVHTTLESSDKNESRSSIVFV